MDDADTTDTSAAHAPAHRVRLTTAGKIIKLLESLAAYENGVGVRELAREIGIDKTAVSRLFDQLCTLGIAQRDSASGLFRVGPAFFSLAATVHGRDTLWLAAAPIIGDLAVKFNETCYLAVREGDEIVFRDKVDCKHTLRYVIDPGERALLHAGAGGRAILLGIAEDEARAILARTGLPVVTASTITDIEELMRQVNEDRTRCYAMSMGERVRSGCAVAAPYFRADGACVGSIVFTCPTERFDIRRAPEIADAVVDASRQLSARLGFVSANPMRP